MVDACQRASAHTVNVVLPYFRYARQDRTAAPREPITAKLVANMLVKAGGRPCCNPRSSCGSSTRLLRYPSRQLVHGPLFADHYIKQGLTGSDVRGCQP